MRCRAPSPGTACCRAPRWLSALWFLATTLFGWYLQRYADYSIIYGSLGVGIALLVWMYMISLVVLVGAEFNAMLFPARPAGHRADRNQRAFEKAVAVDVLEHPPCCNLDMVCVVLGVATSSF